MRPDDDAAPSSHGSIVGLVAGRAEDARDAVRRVGEWRRELLAELGAMPDTLRRIREGAANFELVGQRLADSSESLEQITAIYESTLASTTRRSAEAAEALRAQLDSVVGQSPERVSSTLAEMQRTVELLAQLNPFWPGGRRPPPTR